VNSGLQEGDDDSEQDDQDFVARFNGRAIGHLDWKKEKGKRTGKGREQDRSDAGCSEGELDDSVATFYFLLFYSLLQLFCSLLSFSWNSK
jgi:hypothetical protein